MNKLACAANIVMLALCGACSSSLGESEVGPGPARSGAAGQTFILDGNGAATSSGSGDPTKSGSSGSSGPSGSSGQSGPSGQSGSSLSCMPLADGAGCVGEQYAGESVPLDVYILFDQSCSMSCPISQGGPGQCCIGGSNQRIVPVRAALDAFLHAPESAGIGFGLGYFGANPLGHASCSPADYQTPAVTIGNGHADTLIASLDRAMPTGETPTGAALRGACSYVRKARQAQPSHSVVILLVTDGVPETPVTQCGATLPDAVQAASDCANDPTESVKTYVLGVGQALTNLNQIASAGGTKQAHLVEGGDATASILSALNAIRGDATIPCQLKIPTPPSNSTLDFNTVNVGVCAVNGSTQTTYNVSGAEQCANNAGWYYDDPTNPKRIMLCKASCDTVSVPGAQLYYSIGCATQTVLR